MASLKRIGEVLGGNSKRQRLDCAGTVIEGILSASTSGAFYGTKLPVQQNLVDVESFFDSNESLDNLTYKIGENVRSALKSTRVKEEGVRNAVYGELKDNHQVQFLASAAEPGNRLAKLVKKIGILNDSYHETSLSSIFDEFKGQLQIRCRGSKMSRIMRGLPDTTTSRPDMEIGRAHV